MQSNPNNPNPNPYGSTSYGGYSDNPYANDPYSQQPQAPDPTVQASPPYGVPATPPYGQPPQQSGYYPPQQQQPPQSGYYPPQQQPQQGYFPPQQPQPPYPGQYMPPQQPKRSGGNRTLLIVLAVLVVLLGVGAAIGIPVKINADNNNATATATTAKKNAAAAATANAQATATAVANTFPFSTELALDDPLKDNSKGQGWHDDEFCKFTGGAYHAFDDQPETYLDCVALDSEFSNFTYQVDAQLLEGEGLGIAFREDFDKRSFYMFIVYSDGEYQIRHRAGKDAKVDILKSGNISIDLKQINQLGVVARGDSLKVYINQKEIDSVTDGKLTTGQIGTVIINGPGSTVAEAAFSNLKVWKLA